MATNKYQEFYETHYGNKKSTSQLSTNQKKINNYKARMAASGIDPEKAVDDRNAVEKFFNLSQNQGAIMDFLELLNRPQQAIFGGWENVQKGGDFLEGAKEGIKGNKETRFKEILENYGMEDLKGIPFTDIFGFVGDVFLDPADLIPLAGWGKAADVLKTGGTLKDAYKATDSLTDIAFKGVGKGVKGTAKLADTGLEKGLKYLDETKGVLNNAGDVVKLKYLAPDLKDAANLLPQAVDAAQDTTGAVGRLQLYKNAKNKLTNAFKVSDAAKDAVRAQRSLDASADTAREASKIKIKQITDKTNDFIKSTKGAFGNTPDEVLNDARMLINSTVNKTMDESTLIKLAKNGDLPAYEEAVTHLEDMLKRDVSEDAIKEIQKRYGKNALSITVDKGNTIKLGKGWNDLQFSTADDIADTLKAKQKRLKEIESLSDADIEKLNPNDAFMLDYEAEDLEKEISELTQQRENYTVKFNRRYTPEQEAKLKQLAQRYGYNEKGYRDFVDSIFGTAWKRQDSDVISEITKGVGDEDLFSPKRLSKNQALLMSPEELYTGRGEMRDVIKPTLESGELGTKANTKFYTDSAEMAKQYARGDENNLYRGLLPKMDDENVLYIGANGASYNDPKLNELAWLPGDVEYDWTNVPYKDFDSYNTFSKITDKDAKKLEKIYNKSENSAEFLENLKKSKDKTLLDNLKSYGIDINSIDRPGGKSHFKMNSSANIDSDNLYRIVQKYNEWGSTDIGSAVEDIFMGNANSTDRLAENIYKNQATKRGTTKYNTISLSQIKDSVAGARGGDDIVTINPGNKDIREANFKALSNKTPALEKESIFDLAEGKKGITKSSVDELNDIIDKSLNTNLGKKYDYLTNDNYVAANILTPEGKSIIDELSDYKGKGIGKGNSNLLNTRKYVGAPEETNNFFREFIDKIPEKDLKDYPAMRAFKNNPNAQFMETDYLKALTNRYVDEKGLANVGSSTQLVSQNLLNDTFKNYDDMLSTQKQIENAYKSGNTVDKKLLDNYKKLTENSPIKTLTNFDNKIPDGYTKMTSKELEDFISKYVKTSNQFGMTENTKQLSSLLKKVANNGNDVAINTDVLRVMGAASDPKNINGLNTLYNKYLNVFKKWKTASPTNFMNNMLGNSSNMMLGGISLADQAKYSPQVIDIMTNGEKYYLQRLAGEALDSSASKTADLWEDFRKMGFGNASLDLAELPEDVRDIIQKKKNLKGVKDYITNGLPSMFGYLNQKGDVAARLTVMLKSYDDPAFLKKLGAKDAYEAISKIMFDPTMLTSTEKKIKQLIPFYTYSKNNLVYHITNMPNNAVKYNRLMKTMKGLQKEATNGNEEDMADYIKESLYIPLPGVDKDGNYNVLRAQLPFGQILELANNPVKQIASMSSPPLKGLYEQATGINTFTGQPLEKFPGQKSTNIDLFGWSPTKKTENLISNLSGLDVALKNASRLMSDDPLSTVLMRNNVNTDKLNRSYDQIDELQNIMKQYEQQGIEFSTINELKKANKNGTVEGLNAIFNKYGINTNSSSSKKSKYQELYEMLQQ